MSITQTVDIPASHRLTIDVPLEAPEGKTIIEFRLVSPTVSAKTEESPKRGFGCAKGQFWMADDFDAPLDDFKDYM